MKFKRLVAALLSATLMISLAACSGNEKPAESQTGEGTTAEAIHVNLAESWGFEYFYTIITPDVSSSTGYDEDYTYYSRKAVNNHVSNLRKKLKIAPDLPDYIKSVYGIGYKFEVE